MRLTKLLSSDKNIEKLINKCSTRPPMTYEASISHVPIRTRGDADNATGDALSLRVIIKDGVKEPRCTYCRGDLSSRPDMLAQLSGSDVGLTYGVFHEGCAREGGIPATPLGISGSQYVALLRDIQSTGRSVTPTEFSGLVQEVADAICPDSHVTQPSDGMYYALPHRAMQYVARGLRAAAAAAVLMAATLGTAPYQVGERRAVVTGSPQGNVIKQYQNGNQSNARGNTITRQGQGGVRGGAIPGLDSYITDSQTPDTFSQLPGVGHILSILGIPFIVGPVICGLPYQQSTETSPARQQPRGRRPRRREEIGQILDDIAVAAGPPEP